MSRLSGQGQSPRSKKRHTSITTLCLKKVPTFKLSVALSNVNRFSKFCTVGKRMKCATKPVWYYPPHLRRVATLAMEIKNVNFLQIFSRYGRKCKQIFIASTFAIHPQISILSVFKIVICSAYWLQIIFSMSLFFYLFTSAINLWHRKEIRHSGRHSSACQQSTWYSVTKTRFW